MKDDENENAVKFILPSGAEPGSSLYQDYAQPMLSLCEKMSGENVSLAERACMKDFDPAAELDFTANGCGMTIDNFFEIASRYEETTVPQEGFEDLLNTFHILIASLKSRSGAPIIELDGVSTSFREALLPLRKQQDDPIKPRRVYLKRLFKGCDEFKRMLRTLHTAYAKEDCAVTVSETGTESNKKHRRNKLMLTSEQIESRENKNRVLTEIARLHDKGKGMPVVEAVRYLRKLKTWQPRMSGVKDATWCIYFSFRKKGIR